MGRLEDLGGPSNLLRQSLDSVEGLRPLPLLERLKIRKQFKGEEIRIGPSQRWLERTWELRLAAVQGTIYKIALETVARDRDDAVEFSATLTGMLLKVLGAPTDQGEALFIREAEDGNGVLQLANVGGERRIMLFLTSRIAGTFRSL